MYSKFQCMRITGLSLGRAGKGCRVSATRVCICACRHCRGGGNDRNESVRRSVRGNDRRNLYWPRLRARPPSGLLPGTILCPGHAPCNAALLTWKMPGYNTPMCLPTVHLGYNLCAELLEVYRPRALCMHSCRMSHRRGTSEGGCCFGHLRK